MIFKKTSFELASPIWLDKKENEMNLTVLFEAHLSYSADSVLRICAQSCYQVFINGAFVHSGPARAGRGCFRVDALPIGSYLRAGENTVHVLVSSYRCDNFYLVNQAPFFCAEVCQDGRTVCASGTDEWEAYIYEQRLQGVQRYSFQRTFCEVYDFTSLSPLCTRALTRASIVTVYIDTYKIGRAHV